MATGLIALLDDVAAIAKVAAASIDDTISAAGAASAKAAGVVIDDAAVTPRYVHGFSPARELPIVGKIALGSLKNKLVYLLPGAILLSWLAPWAISPLLMLGGAYLCYEGVEKVYELVRPHSPEAEEAAAGDPGSLEAEMVGSAIRTDLILSGEIMAISLATVAERPIWEQAVVLVVVGIGITALVYGAVALIVKADDVGVALARSGSGVAAGLGRGLVKGMPPFLAVLAQVGTAAMLWVGGGIFVHGLKGYGVAQPGHGIAHMAELAGAATGVVGPVVQWFIGALGAGIVGLVLGGVIVAALHVRKDRH